MPSIMKNLVTLLVVSLLGVSGVFALPQAYESHSEPSPPTGVSPQAGVFPPAGNPPAGNPLAGNPPAGSSPPAGSFHPADSSIIDNGSSNKIGNTEGGLVAVGPVASNDDLDVPIILDLLHSSPVNVAGNQNNH